MSETVEKKSALQEAVSHQINRYLTEMKGQKITNLVALVLEQTEPPLFQAAMESCQYNQLRAAKVLGISRITLRAKLIKYFDGKYCGSRKE